MLDAWQISQEDWLQTAASVRTALITLQRHVLRLDSRCVVYQHQVERLQAEVATLKPLQAEVAELRERLGLNSRNSSQLPPPTHHGSAAKESTSLQGAKSADNLDILDTTASCGQRRKWTGLSISGQNAVGSVEGCSWAMILLRPGVKSVKFHARRQK